ncbi:hypothetical protein KY284_037925 [Solanum tuberosum]|nr:hypothetical protein KY284_037925 [Solanum tuberosum]
MVATKIHHTHALFIHLSDTTGGPIVSIQLTGSENYSIWSRSMRIQLLGSVMTELHAEIIYAESARMIWEDLKERFDKVNTSRFYQLHKDMVTLVQGTDTAEINEPHVCKEPTTCNAQIDHVNPNVYAGQFTTNYSIGKRDFPRAPHLTEAQHGNIKMMLDKKEHPNCMASMAGMNFKTLSTVDQVKKDHTRMFIYLMVEL